MCPSSAADEAAFTKETVLELPPSPSNPRNSEGDFIQLRDGRILFVYTHFTGGSGDHSTAHLASRQSTDGGRSWNGTDELIVSNEGGMNVMSVSLLRLQDGSIALFYLRKNAEDDCRPLLRLSHDEARSWGEPTECVPSPVGYYVVNNDRVIQTQSGRLIIPAALHALKGESFSQRGRVVCYWSDDGGTIWTPSDNLLEAPEEIHSGFQEPGIVELERGRLLMLLRNSSGVLYRSFSEDAGMHWSLPEPTSLRSPVSPASLEKLPGTNTLVLIWNDHAQADPSDKRRSPLTLAISRDNGESWEHPCLIETDPEGWYCYTAIHFTPEDMLLAYCAGDTRTMRGLSLTRISRIPLNYFNQLQRP